MTVLVSVVITGVIATAVMSLALYMIHWRGFANADMINAIGSLFTRSEEDALSVGLVVHFLSGVIFALLYVGLWSVLAVDSVRLYLMLGLITGFAHGFVVSFILVAVVAHHHPIERFRNAGIGVAAAHLLAHVIYGAVVGFFAGYFQLRFDFLPILAQLPG